MVSLIKRTECIGGDENISRCPTFSNSLEDAYAEKCHTEHFKFFVTNQKNEKKVCSCASEREKIGQKINNVDTKQIRHLVTLYSLRRQVRDYVALT